MKNEITTTLRMPKDLAKEIEAVSKEVGSSANGTMLILIKLGLKIYKGKFIVSLEE